MRELDIIVLDQPKTFSILSSPWSTTDKGLGRETPPAPNIDQDNKLNIDNIMWLAGWGPGSSHRLLD